MAEYNPTNLKPIPQTVFFNKFMKIKKYQYSSWTAGMRGNRVLEHSAEGTC